ncbi:MAG: helix-turn-helix transcriptional regulator [Coriobacteriales bacterium]|jgi:DNA-binding CsgD family transcriptional regulator|nr:helix-turn-helix transcriptional regulator [Coriobacteriales bacterium]
MENNASNAKSAGKDPKKATKTKAVETEAAQGAKGTAGKGRRRRSSVTTLPPDEHPPGHGLLNDDKQLSAMISVGIGFCCYWTCFFYLFFGSAYPSEMQLSLTHQTLFRVVALAGMLAVLYPVSRLCDFFATGSGERLLRLAASILLPGLALTLLAQGLLGQPTPLWLGALLWFCGGVSLGATGLLWTSLVANFDIHVSAQCLCISVAAGGALFLLVDTVPLAPAAVFLLLLPLGGQLLHRMMSAEVAKASFGNRVQTLERSPLVPPTDAYLALYGLVFGLAACIVNGLGRSIGITLALSGTLILGSLAMSLFFRNSGDHMVHGSAQRYVVLLLVIALVPLGFVSDLPYMICAFLLVLGFICLNIVNLGAQMSLAYHFKSQPLYLVGRGRLPMLSGMLIGYIIGAGVLAARLEGHDYLLPLALVLVILVSTFIALVPLEQDRYAQASQPVAAIVGGSGHWKKRCLVVSERYRLSARESEVLDLLAKGRSIAFIQNKLFISSHTVKTHAYNIYKKLKVNSKEELITLIESIEPPDEMQRE